MSLEHVKHSDIVRFGDERVNLKREDAAELRRQGNLLRDRLESYLKDHPEFSLKKMLLSGSLAKGTALKSISDLDVGCYVASDSAPHKVGELIPWMAERLRNAFPNIKPEQVKPKSYSVGMTFIATGNEIDVVPIHYKGDKQWRGEMVSQDTGQPLMTSIPMHLDFIRKRKAANDKHFAQLVRLLKFWTKLQKQEDDGFRFKSFMVELILAHLADKGIALNDYPEALQAFFTWIAKDGFKTPIVFPDYYDPAQCKTTSDPIRIWDPVNPQNNIASLYDAAHRSKIIEAALDAGDAIDAAARAMTKAETLRYWRKVFGPTFDA